VSISSTLYKQLLRAQISKAQKEARRTLVVNFINILRAHFLYKSKLSSFSLLRVWLWTNLRRKNARKMLMKLTPVFFKRFFVEITFFTYSGFSKSCLPLVMSSRTTALLVSSWLSDFSCLSINSSTFSMQLGAMSRVEPVEIDLDLCLEDGGDELLVLLDQGIKFGNL